MTNLRDRVLATNTKSVAEAEARRRAEMEQNAKEAARDREMARWFGDFGAKKPMKVFEATVGTEDEVTEETTTGVRNDGTQYSTDYAVFPLSDVICEEGEAADSIRFVLPEPGKDWSQHSEGAITVRESNGLLQDLFSLCGKRWRFEGDWMPTFLGKANASGNRFWNGTYYYKVSVAGEGTATAPVTPDLDALRDLIAAAVQGNLDVKIDAKRTTWTNAKLLRVMQASGIDDKALESMIVNSSVDALLDTAESLGIAAVENGEVSLL